MAAQTANTFTAITSEQLANSIGGTIIANTVRISNATANGTSIEFLLAGQSLPITLGSITNYPPVLVSFNLGANGNNQDPALFSTTVNPSNDQNGAFVVTGVIVLRTNGAADGPNNANISVTSVAQIPTVSLAGAVDGVKAVYSFPSSNGASNLHLGIMNATQNVANLSVFVQPQSSTQNCNTSITSLVFWTCNGAGVGII